MEYKKVLKLHEPTYTSILYSCSIRGKVSWSKDQGFGVTSAKPRNTIQTRTHTYIHTLNAPGIVPLFSSTVAKDDFVKSKAGGLRDSLLQQSSGD